MNEGCQFIAVCVAVLLLGLAVFFSGYVAGTKGVQIEAIEAHVAHWTVDPATGKTTFEFIKPEVPQ